MSPKKNAERRGRDRGKAAHQAHSCGDGTANGNAIVVAEYERLRIVAPLAELSKHLLAAIDALWLNHSDADNTVRSCRR